MGRSGVKFELHGALSSHNSRQDKIDRLLWEDLVEELEKAIKSPRYDGLRLSIIGDGVYWRESDDGRN